VVKNTNSNYAYNGINEFSSAGIGYEKDNTILNMVTRFEDFSTTEAFLNQFDEVWNDKNILKDVTKEVSSYIVPARILFSAYKHCPMVYKLF
jgi:hypothetical protein